MGRSRVARDRAATAWLALVAAAASVTLATVVDAPRAEAAPPVSMEVVFRYTGAVQSWVVPDGITRATIEALGAEGGGSPSWLVLPPIRGGLGGYTKAAIKVTPGQTLWIFVGGKGKDGVTAGGSDPPPDQSQGGFNGGGTGGIPLAISSGSGGGGGGGASDVRIGGVDVSNRVVVAGGGGGSSSKLYPLCGLSHGGSGGGLIGADGIAATDDCIGGVGGNQDGTTGSGLFGFGGTGRRPFEDQCGGGGGGGGYWGGGGGFLCAGGGGGSGFGPSWAVSLRDFHAGDGAVVITADNAPTITLVKHVVNGASGGTATNRSWLLQAVGPPAPPPSPPRPPNPTSIFGRTGDPEVTQRPLDPGTYTLSEAFGPIGYSASSWFCRGAPFTGDQVTMDWGDQVTCDITNTAIAPTLTLVKEVENGDTGAFKTPQDWTLSADGPRLVSGPSGSPAVTNVTVAAGTYTLQESGPRGYTASSWDCVGAIVTGNQLVLPLRSNATCTITNTAVAPRLTLVKQVDNGQSGGSATPDAWTLTAAGPVTISGRTGDASVTDVAVRAGTYTLSESGGPPNYGTNGFPCDGGSQVGPFLTLTEGDDVTCTITNTAITPRLTLVKAVDNSTTGGTAVPTDWTLAADGPTPIIGGSGTPAVTNAAVAVGTYTLSESTSPPGYTASSWVCTGGSASTGTTISVGLGDSATCTITNTAVAPALTLVKVVDNGTTGGTAVPADWTLTAAGPSTISGSPAVTAAAVPAGTYTLSEAGGPSGYTSSAWVCTGGTSSTGATVTVALGQNATCTITNTAIAPTLTLVKVVDNGATGGTAVPTDWTLNAAGPIAINGPSGSPAVTGAMVIAGDYFLFETGGPTGYTASAWTCTGGTVSFGNIVTVAVGQNAICTITNTAVAPTLTLVKAVDNGSTGGTAVPAEWTLSADGPTPISGPNGSPAVTRATVRAGTYELSEADGPTGYTASAWTCTGGTTSTGTAVTVAVGNNATCTITNTAVAPTLTLIKQVSNAHGGTALPNDWTLSADGPTPISGTSGSPAVTDATVTVGTYALSEAGGPTDYSASAWTCTGAPVTGGNSITLTTGAIATCTIVNADQPARLTLRKVVDPAASGSGKVPADWTLTATPVNIAGQDVVSGNGDPTSPGGVSSLAVSAGSYTLGEAGPPGFDAGEWVCQGGVLTDTTVTLTNGATVICTIANTARTPRLTLRATVDNASTGATTGPEAWTLSAGSPTPISGLSGSPAVTAAPVAVGVYTLRAIGPAGYTAAAWTCTGAPLSGTTLALIEGSDTTCTIAVTAIAPQLTLVKEVRGGPAAPTAWTLRAAGPTIITGATSSAAVTTASVQVGSYVLTESGGPSGYTAAAWVCIGATISGDIVTVVLGARIVCTIVSTHPTPPPAPPPPNTLPKTGGGDRAGALVGSGLALSVIGLIAVLVARRRRRIA